MGYARDHSPTKTFSTDVTDHEWELIEYLVPKAKPGGTAREISETRSPLMISLMFWMPRAMFVLGGRSPTAYRPESWSSMDYVTQTRNAMILVVMIHLTVRRLAA